VALDFDKPQWNEQKQRMVAPGAEACGWWSKTFPDTWKRWPVPEGKDPGEAFQAGIDLRKWASDGLPPALRVEIKAPVVTTQAKTVTKTEPLDTGNDHSAALCSASAREETGGRPVCAKLRSKTGHEYYVTDSPSEYKRLQAESATVFSPKEIDIVKQATSLGATEHELQIMFECKRVFGGFFTKTEKLGA
jgi:hypothetical protein